MSDIEKLLMALVDKLNQENIPLNKDEGMLSINYDGITITIQRSNDQLFERSGVGVESFRTNSGMAISAMAPGSPCSACGGSGRV